MHATFFFKWLTTRSKLWLFLCDMHACVGRDNSERFQPGAKSSIHFKLCIIMHYVSHWVGEHIKIIHTFQTIPQEASTHCQSASRQQQARTSASAPAHMLAALPPSAAPAPHSLPPRPWPSAQCAGTSPSLDTPSPRWILLIIQMNQLVYFASWLVQSLTCKKNIGDTNTQETWLLVIVIQRQTDMSMASKFRVDSICQIIQARYRNYITTFPSMF
jgi:hypothetical protein